MKDIFLYKDLSFEEKTFIAEGFLDQYKPKRAQDMYRWLWEGEFGPGSTTQELTLERLQLDVRKARMHFRKTGSQVGRICEDAGLTRRFLKINLMVYADSGCPLKRLIMLAERLKDARPDPLRFKKDWAFMKTQIIPGMHLSLDMLNNFETQIAFHMSPEVQWSEDWNERMGDGYWMAPRLLFFHFFPEYEF